MLSAGPVRSEALYTFVVAGHVYGTPGEAPDGYYHPLREALQNFSPRNKVAFGVILGDSVYKPSASPTKA